MSWWCGISTGECAFGLTQFWARCSRSYSISQRQRNTVQKLCLLYVDVWSAKVSMILTYLDMVRYGWKRP